MTRSNENRLFLCVIFFTYYFACLGEENIKNNDFSFLYECDWDVYNNTQLLHEMQVKSRIQCATLCLQYQTGCLGFELYKTSVTSCRFFREDLRNDCVPPSSSASFFYRRTNVPSVTMSQLITQGMTTSSEEMTTSSEFPTTTSNPCQNGGTPSGFMCSCVFGCSGQYCQTCINECNDATGVSGTGTAWIKPSGFDVAKQVWCNFDHGVTYVQIRKFGNVNFNRSYAEYENGFGDANGDFWLGNKYVHTLSNLRSFKSGFTVMKSSTYSMVYYYDFVVLDSASNYAVQYSSASSASYPLATGQPFQAYDTVSACAKALGCGWWFTSTCSSGSLNGPYPVTFGTFSGATTTRIGIF